MDVQNFTPWSALAGGALIGLAATVLLFALGRVAGISGILGGVLLPSKGDTAWRVSFLAGLVLAGLFAVAMAPERLGASPRSWLGLALAGALVGVGTRLASGCTSGHGVCGLSRLDARSFAATGVFMSAGVLTATAVRLLGGGP
jgi:uncharacterized protein